MPPFGLLARRKSQQQETNRIVVEYVLAPDEQADRLLREHGPALRSDAAEKTFDRLLREAADDPNTTLLITNRYIRAWTPVQDDLAAQYLARGTEDSGDSWSKAVDKYLEALEELDPFEYPNEWGTTSSDLARAYQSMELPGDAGILHWALLDNAILYFTLALFGWTRDRFPRQWARVQLDLGLTFLARLRGERSDNVAAAIEHLHYAEEVLTAKDAPDDWVSMQGGLGLAYTECVPAETEQSIQHFQNALSVCTREFDAGQWANLQYMLGTTYLNRAKGGHSDDIEEAIDHLRLALEVQPSATDSERWVLAQTGLGIALGRRTRGPRPDNVRHAIVVLQRALQGSTLEQDPRLHLMAQDGLGDVYLSEGRWDEAQKAYRGALSAQELLFRHGASTEERYSWLRGRGDLPVKGAYCLARLGHIDEAIETAERGKARVLGEGLALHQAPVALARPSDRAAFLAARKRISELEAQARTEVVLGTEDLEIRETLSKARDQKTVREIWERLRVDTDATEASRLSALEISAQLREARHDLDEVVSRIEASVASASTRRCRDLCAREFSGLPARLSADHKCWERGADRGTGREHAWPSRHRVVGWLQ
jgi:tetratricopeptide (TPR) repeat protein